MENKNGTQIEEFEKVDEALHKVEGFMENNTSKLLIGVAVVCLAVFGVIYYSTCVKAPKNETASSLMADAERRFAMDSFDVALNDPDCGFLAIINEYGSTDAASAAKAYAGVCYKQLGDYENAIKYLKGIDVDDVVSPALQGAVGDCYSDLGNDSDAIAYYKKAIASGNEIVAPVYAKRLAIIYMDGGKNDEAVKLLEETKQKYGNSAASSDIEKLIQVAKSK